MDQISFGMVLRDARERKGYDLANAARRLRIRPDILQAIEASDFSRMPPRGYARNMVNAYARYLGLNPTEITRMYLDECYAFQVGKARMDARSTGFDMSGAPANKRGGRRDYDDEPESSSALGRKLYVDDPHRDRRRDGSSMYDRPHGEDRTHRTNRSA
ncbi:MAG: helix-turn-helix transcriptional regulator, partial [Raoultibacter sp.]